MIEKEKNLENKTLVIQGPDAKTTSDTVDIPLGGQEGQVRIKAGSKSPNMQAFKTGKVVIVNKTQN